jgi:hypothetical protein
VKPLSYSQPLWIDSGDIMDLTYQELLGLFLMTPIVIFVAYWNGFKAGKREGYLQGRKWLRFPSKVSE